MKKLKLNLDDLKVESFETNSTQSKLGTVIGQGGTLGPDLPEPEPTYGAGLTCDFSNCVGAPCYQTGGDTCPCNTYENSCFNCGLTLGCG